MRLIRLVLVLLLCLVGTAAAQTYPNRAVRVIIPFPPGGAPDLTGRVLAARLAERLGQPFVAENRTGAGGNIATDAVAKSAPDGYTLLAGSDGPLVINPNVYVRTGFDTLRDFAPISIATSSGFVLMACPKVPAEKVAQLVALAKTRQLSIGSSGFGSNHHLAAEMLKAAAGIQLTHVPYKGFGNAVVDAIGCNVDLLFGSTSAGIPHVTSGKLRALAVTQPRRHPGLPDTPTFAEAGYPSVAMDAYFGMLAPAGTPKAIIDRLHAEISAILQEKETRDRLTGAGLDIVGSTPEQFTERMRADLAKYAELAKSLGAKAE
jgi:tripartite-type tricarboxylate transporter receptor subunit TctC